MVHPHQSLWSKAAGAAGGVGVAVATIAAMLHGSGSAARFWTSDSMLVAYGLTALAVIFFFLGLAGCPFPLGDGVKGRRKKQNAALLHDNDHLAPSNSVRPHSQLREALDLTSGRAELGEALSLFDVGEPARPVKHSYCVKCGFPFVRPQPEATCSVDRPGENWCRKRARTSVNERSQHMTRNANTLYRVHPEWAVLHEGG